MKITFKLNSDDNSIYTVVVNGREYSLSRDESTIEFNDESEELQIEIHAKIPHKKFKDYILLFLLSCIKIPLFAIFDYTFSSKWYENIPVYVFDYSFTVKTPGNDLNITIQNRYTENKRSGDSPIIIVDGEYTEQIMNYKICCNSLKVAMVKFLFDIAVIVIILSVIAGLILLNHPVVFAIVLTLFVLLFVFLIIFNIRKYRKIVSMLSDD